MIGDVLPSSPPVTLGRVPLDTNDRADPLGWGLVAVVSFCLRAATTPLADGRIHDISKGLAPPSCGRPSRVV